MKPNQKSKEEQWSDLKRFLLEEEAKRLNTLEGKILHPENFAKSIGEVLADAVQNTEDKNRLSQKLYPVVEESLYKSVQKNPESLADAIYPVITPAIRKAINEAMKKISESVNHSVNQGLSPRNIKLRLRALFTGQSYGDLVLKYSLLFQVQEIYLIHNETGLLISHISQKTGINPAGDMISGMLAAIRDFVSDSFQVDRSESLQSIEVGDLNVWIEPGPHASMACVVKGEPSTFLRDLMQDAVQKIHQDFGPDLSRFKGNTSGLEDATLYMEPCLITELDRFSEKTSGKTKWILGIIGVLALCLIVPNIYFSHLGRQLDRDIQTNGYQIILKKRNWQKFRYTLSLADPSASSLRSLLSNHPKIDPEKAQFVLLQEIKEKHINQPLPEISPTEKIKQFLGADTINVGFESTEDQILIKGTLTAKRRNDLVGFLLNHLPKTSVDYSGLKIFESEMLSQIREELDSLFIFFESNSFKVSKDQTDTVIHLNFLLNEFNAFCRELGEFWVLEVSGSADQEGSGSLNDSLIRKRILFTIDQLIDKELDYIFVRASDRGSTHTQQIKKRMLSENQRRHVSFELKKVNEQ